MRVLVACEFSGVVRCAFAARGHDVWSCDLEPAEDDSPNHVQGDVRPLLWLGWDLMIAHPPCTFLSKSGLRWLYVDGRKKNGMDFQRWADMYAGAEFFNAMVNAPIARVCVENPRMHPYAQALCGAPTQYVQPWQFGHGEVKETGFRLRNLEPLKSTNVVSGRHARVHRAAPGPNRWKERSRTYEGIARAMAEQWG